ETKLPRDIPAFAAKVRKDEKFMPPALVLAQLNEKQEIGFRKVVDRFSFTPDDWIQPLNKKVEPDRSKWIYPKADDEKNAPGECDFPLWELGLTSTQGKPQQPYTVTIWVEAVDTDLDSELDEKGAPRPHLGQMQEKMKFKVVSDNELLVEIGKEEEELRKKFDEMFEALLVRES